ncbi:formin-like protein 20 [Dorcoceras hygrometricum]|uniref:Formin-like protein 20 n=1 Tax=Dorcoceras hygrometricum TaxID=472368 RepID=A0A2Z7ACN5_9LAMI|nr:formin-like protein 20 [Dorcoceras hygrometricum]
MTFRVVRTNQYNQDLGLIHSTNGNHLESPNEGSSIDHQDARASGNTALSSPCWVLLATMRRVVNYHSAWARQQQVELFDASDIRPSAVIRCLMHSICILSYAFPLAISVALRNPGFTAGRGFNPAGGAPGGG